MPSDREEFQRLKHDAQPYLPAILCRLLPGGRVEGREYIALNPRRADKRPGSFKVNLLTGCWADFAVNAGGGDVISLVAYLFAVSQREAARLIAQLIGYGRAYD